MQRRLESDQTLLQRIISDCLRTAQCNVAEAKSNTIKRSSLIFWAEDLNVHVRPLTAKLTRYLEDCRKHNPKNTMSEHFRVAFAVPVYNEAAAIRVLIQELSETILTQHSNAELFIFEDGSTDGTKEILTEIDRRKLARVHVRSTATRKGYPTAVRDSILSVDRGAYTHVFFMDSDRQYYIDDV